MSDDFASGAVPHAQFPLQEAQIAARVAQLGAQIDTAFPRSEPLVVIGLLRACFVFMADLVREVKRPVEVEFISARSYVANKSGGKVHIDTDGALSMSVEGKHVLLVDTMLDYGHTMTAVVEAYKQRNAKSLSACLLLRKPHSPRGLLPREFVGFDVPDAYAVGYGLDNNGGQRNQRFISAI